MKCIKFWMHLLIILLIQGKGQEICDLYCKPFSGGSLADRRKYLAKYNFSCGCAACSQDWPTLDCLPASLDTLPPAQYNLAPARVNQQVRCQLTHCTNHGLSPPYSF